MGPEHRPEPVLAPVGHWSEAWLGRPYGAGESDCAALVADVVAERTGRRLALPGRAAGLRGRDRQIAAAADAAVETTTPADGDVVLMQLRDRRDGVGYHVGVFCVVEDAAHVLHCLAGLGVCRHPVAGIESRGYRVIGYYRPAFDAVPIPCTNHEPKR